MWLTKTDLIVQVCALSLLISVWCALSPIESCPLVVLPKFVCIPLTCLFRLWSFWFYLIAPRIRRKSTKRNINLILNEANVLPTGEFSCVTFEPKMNIHCPPLVLTSSINQSWMMHITPIVALDTSCHKQQLFCTSVFLRASDSLGRPRLPPPSWAGRSGSLDRDNGVSMAALTISPRPGGPARIRSGRTGPPHMQDRTPRGKTRAFKAVWEGTRLLGAHMLLLSGARCGSGQVLLQQSLLLVIKKASSPARAWPTNCHLLLAGSRWPARGTAVAHHQDLGLSLPVCSCYICLPHVIHQVNDPKLYFPCIATEEVSG